MWIEETARGVNSPAGRTVSPTTRGHGHGRRNDTDMTRKITILLPDDAPPPALKLLQAAVGGLIEPVDRFLPMNLHAVESAHDPVVVAYANEEGAIRGLPENASGSAAVRWPLDAADPIRGPVVVLEGWQRGHFTGEFDDETDDA